ncbi:MAG: O-antigen ligase family protein [Anaerolineae bacterium]|nr:O-antigen ligase family protein [Anaerolineae bacterium]MDW8173148.1 O-antigen ligase family protein [Anaerolineae bacterium]
MLRRTLTLLFAFYLTFVGGGAYYALVFPVRVAHHAVMTLLLGLWLLRRARCDGLPDTGFNRPLMALFLGWMASALLSIDPRMALESLWFGLLHLLIFFYAVRRIQRGDSRVVMEALFFLGMVVVFITALEFGSWYFGWGIIPGTEVGWLTTGQLIPPLDALPNARLALSVTTLVGAYCAPLVVLSWAWMTTVGSAYRRVLALLGLSLLVVLFLTSARGGGLSLLVGLGAWITLRLAQSEKGQARLKPRTALLLGSFAGLALIVGFLVWTVPRGGVSNAGRLDMWRGALLLAFEHPLLGVGYGQFGRAFREVRDPAVAQDQLASAHNLYLNTLAETGIVGAALALWAVFAWAAQVRRHWLAASSAQRRRIEAALCALLGLAAHSLVEVLSVTPLALLAVLLAAYASTPSPTSRLDPIRPGDKRLAWAAMILVVAYGLAFVRLDQAQAVYMASMSATTVDEAYALARQAEALDPWLNLYDLHMAYLLTLDEARADEALPALQAVLRLEPSWDVGWVRLADLYERTGRLDEALSALERAKTIHGRTTAGIHWARLAETLGAADDEIIVEHYVRGLTWSWVLDRHAPLGDFWQATPLRREAVARFSVSVPPETWRIAAEQEDEVLFVPQQFAAVLYQRPAIFIYPPSMRYPE